MLVPIRNLRLFVLSSLAAALLGAKAPSPKTVPAQGDNLAASALGGVVESITGEVGPGFTGPHLTDGKPATTWRAGTGNFPQELVFSFFERRSASISAVTLTLAGGSAGAPKEVEVWTSTEGPKLGFRKVAHAILKEDVKEPSISFAAADATFVKLRVLSTQKAAPLELGEVAVIEATRAGYVPLTKRYPEMANWSKSPRHAAQLGIDWLEPAAVGWQRQHNCYGCHNQAQVIMGLSVAKRNHYVVDEDCVGVLTSFTAGAQHPNGSFHNGAFVTATQFAAMAFAVNDDATGAKMPGLIKAVDYLIQNQKVTGEVPIDHNELPIDQGSILATSNAALAFDQAARESGVTKYREALNHALAWMIRATPVTTQDEVYQILTLTRFGSPERRRVVDRDVQQLEHEQNSDGGWQETRDSNGSNGYATGQVLYALKAAGIAIDSPAFRRGVGYLISTQMETGAWPSIHSHSARPSEFAPTMWAVIGLAGSFRESKTGSLQVVSQLVQPTDTQVNRKNVLIVLDESGSMKAPLGKSTRIQTARKVIQELLEKIPSDYNVGLRLYAHRAKAATKETCTDTELVLPVGPLDRAKFIDTVDKVQPRGDTPLVYATLKAPEDLTAVGGGSVILITDGEESCGGDPKEAAKSLRASRVGITLDIVGFTLTGKKVQSALTQLAEATGGHFFPANDGDALSRSLAIATFRYPYEVFDTSGHSIAKGTADGSAIDLKPGDYRVVVYAGGQTLKRDHVTVKASSDALVRLVGEGEHLSLAQ